MAALEELFQSDESEDEKITINKTFAAKYQKFKECQELDKLKAKYGDVPLDEDSSSSEEEDDDAEALTPQLEEDFLKTLSMIKSKDPKIYDKATEFFHKEDKVLDALKTSKKKAEKPLLLKDYERQRLLERGSKAYLSDSDSENEEVSYFVDNKKPSELTYNEEQEEIKKSFKDVLHDDEDEDLLQVREKSSQEKEVEEKDYKQWLKREGKTLVNFGQFWTRDDLDEDDKFLRDYILNRKFVDEGQSIPSYKDIVGESDEEDQDEEELEREEEFERKFNFRYEEPDQEFIKRYPRTIAESVRRTDDKRKLKRKERDERKDKEKEKKKEELKRLKNLKRKEIMEKLEKLKKITGNDKVGFLEDDMEGDFDASKYDKIMQSVFDEQYYDVEDEEKPEFSDDEMLQEENWDEWTGQDQTGGNGEGEHCAEGEYLEEEEEEGYEAHCDDPDFIMDADYVDTRSNKKKEKDLFKNKKKSKLVEALQRQKPVFDPKEKTFEEYFDEYYKLDFEDIIGDMPVRFKYRQVVPNDYGLTTDEILNAEDKELNEWCSLKRTIRYNTEQEEKTERQKYKKKSRNAKKKEQVFQSIHEKKQAENTLPNQQGQKKDKVKAKMKTKTKLPIHRLNQNSQRGFKKKFHSAFTNTSTTTIKNSQGKQKSIPSKTQQKKLLKRFKGADSKVMKKISTNRLAAYGLDKRKKKQNEN